MRLFSPATMEWLQKLADEAEQHLESLPERCQPYWYREHYKKQ